MSALIQSLNFSNFTMNVVITSLESMYNYSNVTLISMNLCKSFLCPCTLSGSNKITAKIIPKARLNDWHTPARSLWRRHVFWRTFNGLDTTLNRRSGWKVCKKWWFGFWTQTITQIHTNT